MTKSTYIAGLLFLSLGEWQTVRATGPELSVAPVVRQQSEAITRSSAEFNIEVQGLTPPVSRSIEISGPAQDIHLRLADGLDFSSIDGLAHSLIKPGMTDEEKVKACFYFAVNNLYDRGARGCDDPLEYISLWGFSYCGNYALLLKALWEAIDFQTAYLNPTIGLPMGHGITAVFYDNQWHMYDSRMRGYFLKRDNRTVASPVELDRDDDLIRRGLDYDNHMMGHWDYYITMGMYSNAASDWYDGYDRHFDSNSWFNKDCPPWDRRLSLRAGEKLTLNWTNKGKWWNRKELSPRWLELHSDEGREAMTVPPMIYANGSLEFKLDPRLYKKQAEEFDGIRVMGDTEPLIQPSTDRRTGYLVYKIKVPYFIPSMHLEATGFRQSSNDSLTIEISTDEGRSWLPLWRAEGTGEMSVSISTDETQRVTWFSSNKYSYLLRFTLHASHTAADISLSGIKITTDLFYRPLILPALQPGINRLVYSDRSAGDSQRRITYRWLENTNILFSEDQPCEGDQITVTALVNNEGYGPARAVKVRFFDGDPALGGVQIGEDQVIARIDPGQSGRAQVEWRALQRQLGAISGFSLAHEKEIPSYTHNTIFVQADPENALVEVNENDNLTSREIVVHNMANLVLKDPSFIEFERRDEKVLITAFIRNQNLYGFLPQAREARNVRVRFYDGQPQVQNLSAKMIGETLIPEIAPGEFGVARVKWDVSELTGRRVVYVVADPQDEIPEKWQHKKGDFMFVKKEINLADPGQARK